ncbi:MAG: PAS domain-containing protein, partial [Armatimonadota bacterium]
MRLRRHAVALALGFGGVAWLLDALIMYVILDSGALADCLILGLSAADWVRRIGVLVLFGIVGYLLAEAPEEEVSTDEPESDAPDTGQFAYAAQVMMIGLDAEGRITLFNRRCEEVTGHAAEELVGTSFFDSLLPSRALPNILPAFHSVLANGGTVRREAAWLTRSGPEIVVSSHLSPVYDEGGEIVGVVIVAQDVTEYRLTDAELLLSREPWRPLAESVMGDGLAAIDADGGLTWVSLSLAEMLGEEREALVGQRLEELVVEHDRERLRDGLSRVSEEKLTVNEEFTAASVDARMPVQIALQPMESVRDEDAGAFVIVRDLAAVTGGKIAADTTAQASEDELVRMRAKLEAAEARAEEAGEAARAESAEEIEALQAELASAQERVAEVEREAEARLDELRDRALEERQAQVAELTAKLEAAEARAEEAEEEAKREFTSQLSGLAARAEEAERAVEAARAEKEREVEELRERVSSALEDVEAAETDARDSREAVENLREELSAAHEEAAEAVQRAT